MTRLMVVTLFPLLSAAQGDEGNARVLRHRAGLRGIDLDLVTHDAGPVPRADIYLLGGLDEVTLPELARRLVIGDLPAAVADGAAVLAVGAGFQVVGRSFEAMDGGRYDGVGLLNVSSVRTPEPVAGPVITLPNDDLSLGALSGYECHQSAVELGAGVSPLAWMELGVGNGDTSAHPREGAVAGHVIGTHIHGPVLARNADLADLLLGWVVGGSLDPLPAHLSDELRQRRIAEDRLDPTGWGGRRYGPPSLRSLISRR